MLFSRSNNVSLITSILLLGAACEAAPGMTDSSAEATPQPLALEAGATPTLAGCPAFPADNQWNRRVASDPVDPRSAAYMAGMNAGSEFLHADFGGGGEYGIPWVAVPASQPRVPMSFDYEDDSDPGPYPIPAGAPIEGGPDSDGDRHILVVDKDNCMLFETFDTWPAGAGFRAGSGAIFNLQSNQLRPKGLTSADAAGLPILPGLVRHEEIAAGRINHALRFTVRRTQRGYVHPATHFASVLTDPSLPPMGLRVRLRADFDLSRYSRTAQIILTALKEYGMFMADNGSDWFISGEQNPAWNDDELHELKGVPAAAFEVVQHGEIQR
jgi:hypothetical protein